MLGIAQVFVIRTSVLAHPQPHSRDNPTQTPSLLLALSTPFMASHCHFSVFEKNTLRTKELKTLRTLPCVCLWNPYSPSNSHPYL